MKETYYRTIVDSPQWKLWVKKNEEDSQWDVYESMELGLMSPRHFQAFIEFCKTV